MVLDTALRLVLWGLSLAAIIIAGWLTFRHQFVGALLAYMAFGALGGLSGYRQLSGAWLGWTRYQAHRTSDELLDLPNDVLDETPYRDD
jgi:hypothetical protein